jgi:hypothetical protein
MRALVKRIVAVGGFLLLLICEMGTVRGQQPSREENVSFKADVFPIIEAHCLPCHAESEFNPSELSMDSYDLMSAGGKHGVPWVPGSPRESLIIKKISENPPFEARMPLNSKKKIREGKATWLSDDEVQTLEKWIEQGARNN